jgi:signal transduction histidine kinase
MMLSKQGRYSIFLFYLLFTIISNASFAQSVNRTPTTHDEYIHVVKYYRYLNPDSAKFFALEGLILADKDKDSLGKAALLNQLGMIEDNFARYNDAKEHYLRAEAIYRELNDPKGLASILIRLSVIDKRKGNYDKSLALAMQALKLSEKNNDKLGMLEARVVFSEIYYILGDYHQTLSNLAIAEQIDSTIPVSNFTLNMYISYGYVYVKLGDCDRAISYLKKGLSKANKVEFNGLKISIYKVLAIAYDKKGDREKSIAYFKYSLEFAKKIKNSMREQSTLIELSDVYSTYKPDSALFYLNRALDIADQFKMQRQQILILDKMSKLYKRKGKAAQALSLKERSAEMAEQYFYKDMSKQVLNLEAAFDLEKSNAKLRELTLKSETQQMQKNVFLYIAIAAILVLLITLAHFFRVKQLNNKLRVANKELEESNDVKDKFFSIIAHDIRSPLVSTIGILELIDSKDIDEETKTLMVNKLIVHCKNSLSILDKLLKWGQMQIKGVRIDQQNFRPIKNIERNLSLLKDGASRKNIKIDLDVPSRLEVFADPDHFDFVIRNLVSNAIKFTNENGLIQISADIDNDNILFKVKDNGVGISEARMKKIFELSAMGTRGTSAEEGTSLGLIICKEFVEANKGRIYVDSVVGEGTTFSFSLKAANNQIVEKK